MSDRTATLLEMIAPVFTPENTPVAWVDGSPSSKDLYDLIAQVSPDVPMVIYADFLDRDSRKELYKWVDKKSVQAFYFSPYEAKVIDGQVEAVYRTDAGWAKIRHPFTGQPIDSVTPSIPSYLWSHTFTSLNPNDVEYGDWKTRVIFPFEGLPEL